MTNFLQDYTVNADGTYSVGKFHEKRRETIIKCISECLNEEINEHNDYANVLGITYEFSLPEIRYDAWVNSINDIAVMSFVQGIPVGNSKGVYYNSYALGGSQIVRRDYLYGQDNAVSPYSGSRVKIYHHSDCPIINGGYTYNYNGSTRSLSANKDDCWMFITDEDALSEGYLPCQVCN